MQSFLRSKFTRPTSPSGIYDGTLLLPLTAYAANDNREKENTIREYPRLFGWNCWLTEQWTAGRLYVGSAFFRPGGQPSRAVCAKYDLAKPRF